MNNEETDVTWYLVAMSLHMVAAQNESGPIQIVKFSDESACQKLRSGMGAEGVFSVCTSHPTDVSGFISAMNCDRGKTEVGPDKVPVQVYFCAPYLSAPK